MYQVLNSIRNKKGLRWFWVFMALYLLNCSVDTSDIKPNCIPENLTINDQETFIEIIVEKVLGFENAIPETEDCDSENNTILKKTVSVDIFILPHFTLIINDSNIKSTAENMRFGETNVLKPYFEIHSPPPEV